MTLQILPYDLTVCKIPKTEDFGKDKDFYFLGVTDEEISLVCRTVDVPRSAERREDGWKGMRIAGALDFSLTGILSKISTCLADAGIGIFAVSTFNTDYVMVKEKDLERAVDTLKENGYEVM